jgi:hypothetical protein
LGGTAILSVRRHTAIVLFYLFTTLISTASPSEPARSEASADLFPVRMIELDASIPSSELLEHLDFYASAGYNAVLVSSKHAGRWFTDPPSEPPLLEQRMLQLARWCSERDITLYVHLSPHSDAAGSFIFSDAKTRKKLRKFCRLLHRKAGVRNFVLSFRQAPLRLTDLRDIVRYGRSAAPAHLDLAAWLRRHLRADDRLWLRPAAASDLNLTNPDLRYSTALLAGLDALDGRVGIVWSGPAGLSPAIKASEAETASARVGGRSLILEDRYSLGPEDKMTSLALALGPLKNREPEIGRHIDVYLYCPMSHRGGSRLSLLTVADFLRDPYAYDPESSWKSAMERLAGGNAAALKALETQAMEWGGWIDERNYRSILLDNPVSAAEHLRDPAMTARWGWTARRYPQRMADLTGLQDEFFREELLETMARRYAVSRAMPLVRELRARLAAGRSDTSELVEQLRRERADADSSAGVGEALDRFLVAAGLSRLF